MKKAKNALVVLILGILLMAPHRAHAQSDFNFNLYGGSSNFWSNTLFQIPASLISNISTVLINEENYIGGSYRYEIFRIRENGGKANTYTGKFFGFKGKDLFSNIQYGLKVGWAPKLSPFGIYLSCSYQFRRFEAQFENTEMNKYKLHGVRPGLGIRITPFIGLLEDDKWSPLIELGTGYNYYFSSKAPYDNNKKQFNNGMTSTFSIGARNTSIAITGGVEIDHYNLFNQDFTPDGIVYPYENVKTKHFTIFVSFSHEFN